MQETANDAGAIAHGREDYGTVRNTFVARDLQFGVDGLCAADFPVRHAGFSGAAGDRAALWLG